MRGYKNNVLRVVNLLLFLSGCFLLGTGLLLAFRLVPGTGGRMTVLGLGRHDWGDLHFYVAIAVVILTLAHLALNWAWMRKIAAMSRVWPLLLGLAVGTIIVVLPLLLPASKM